jgi:hypothetical protein
MFLNDLITKGGRSKRDRALRPARGSSPAITETGGKTFIVAPGRAKVDDPGPIWQAVTPPDAQILILWYNLPATETILGEVRKLKSFLGDLLPDFCLSELVRLFSLFRVIIKKE